MPRRADTNQPAIVSALRQVGCTVLHLHTVGRGCPDLAVSIGISDDIPRTVLMEIKMPGEHLTPLEAEFFRTWQGEAYVVYSPEQAIEIMRG